MILRKVSPISNTFANTLMFCKNLGRKINEDSSAPAEEFNNFFVDHLFKNYCSVIKDQPQKRQYLCELLYAHTCHDLNLRIKIV